jgi:multiple sugar transport system substrate-binding protein
MAMIDNKEDYYNAVTMPIPLGNDGQSIPAQVNAGGGYIPKGAKNLEVAKDFLSYWMRPEVTNENIKAALGRWVPVNVQVVKDDPFWLQNKDPHVIPYVKEITGPTIPFFEGYSPAWGQVSAEQLWGQAHADVIKNDMKVGDAVDKAFKRAEQIFSGYVT